MKLYTLTYNANTPTRQQVNVPTNSDYKIGVKIIRDGEPLELKPNEVTLNGLSADENLTNGYLTFTNSSGTEAYMANENFEVDHDQLAVLSSQEFNSPNRVKTAGVYMYADAIVGEEPMSVKASDLTFKAWDSRGYEWIGKPLFVADVDGGRWLLNQDTHLWSYYNDASITAEEIVIAPSASMTVTYGNYKGVMTMYLDVRLGKPSIHQKFALTENVFKSQVGDIEASYSKEETDEALAGKVTNLSAVSGIMKISQADYAEKSIAGEIDANTLYIVVE